MARDSDKDERHTEIRSAVGTEHHRSQGNWMQVSQQQLERPTDIRAVESRSDAGGADIIILERAARVVVRRSSLGVSLMLSEIVVLNFRKQGFVTNTQVFGRLHLVSAIGG